MPLKRKKIRGMADGVFDMTHFGHYNAFRKAKMMVDELVVIINSDEAVIREKGPIVYNEKERLLMVDACKWVDETHIENFYNEIGYEIIEKYNCDFMLHGDDLIAKKDGSNFYQPFIDKN